MKIRPLLPVAVLQDPSSASVDRILAQSFWGEPKQGRGASVVNLEQLREQRSADAASPARKPARNR